MFTFPFFSVPKATFVHVEDPITNFYNFLDALSTQIHNFLTVPIALNNRDSVIIANLLGLFMNEITFPHSRHFDNAFLVPVMFSELDSYIFAIHNRIPVLSDLISILRRSLLF